MLAPDSTRYVPPFEPTTRRSGRSFHSALCFEIVETIALPGATTSGFISAFFGISVGEVGAGVPGSTTGPRELYDATLSSLRNTVPFVFNAPTVSAPGVKPGDTIAPITGTPLASLPRFPADATTTRLLATARSTASASGSSRYASDA